MSMENRPRGRPAKNVPEVSEEAVKAVKQLSKGYEKAKFRCWALPRKMPTLFRRMEVDTQDYASTGEIGYRRHAAPKIHPKDREVIEQYETDMRNVWLLETGISSIPDERTRAIAEDTLLKRKPAQSIAKKHNISRATAFREKDRALRSVAEFVASATANK